MATNRTFKGAIKPMGKSGHFNEPQRHAMQAKGLKTGNLADAKGLLPMATPKGRLVVKKNMVFKFDELSPKAQEKALEDQRQFESEIWSAAESGGLLEFSENDFKESGVQPLPDKWYDQKLLPDGIHYEGVEYPAYGGLFKYNHQEIYFDLDRGQYLQLNDIKVTDDNVFRKFLGIPGKLWSKISYRFVNERENNTKLSFDSGDVNQKEVDTLLKASEKWDDKMHEGWRRLRDDYEYRLSDENLKETIEANGYEFTEDGKIN